MYFSFNNWKGGERGIIELIDFILGKMFILTADTGALREFGKLFFPSKCYWVVVQFKCGKIYISRFLKAWTAKMLTKNVQNILAKALRESNVDLLELILKTRGAA